MNSDKVIGFICGVAYAAAMVKKHGMDSYDLIKASCISVSDFRRFADETDIKILEEIFED